MPPDARGPQTVGALVADLSRGDSSRPVVTWVDPANGARVELSIATLANWVAKTGGLLQDGLDVEPGDRVRLSLPTHWLAVTWALGCWVVGAVIEPADAEPPDAGDPEVEVFGDDRDPSTAARGVVVGLGAFGGSVRNRVRNTVRDTVRDQHTGVLDAGAEVLGYPDELFVADPPAPTSAALSVGAGGVPIEHAQLLGQARAAAAQMGLRHGGRLLAGAAPCDRAGLVHSVLAPLLAGGSVLLVRDRQAVEAAGGLTELAARERVDVVAPLGSPT